MRSQSGARCEVTNRAKLLAIADRIQAESEWLIGGKARRRMREIARELRALADEPRLI